MKGSVFHCSPSTITVNKQVSDQIDIVFVFMVRCSGIVYKSVQSSVSLQRLTDYYWLL